MRARIRRSVVGVAAIAVAVIVFLVPFGFVILTASKTRDDAAALDYTWPQQFAFFENIVQVVQARDFMLVWAFVNSTVLTVAALTILVVLAAMVGWVLQRRPTRWTPLISFLILAGLILPPAVVPTIWVLQGLGLYGELPGLILIEVAFGLSFCTLMFRAFVATIPREIDEAATIDGAGPIRLFFQVAFPLLRNVIVTVIVVQAVFVFNDFQNALYFLPTEPTVQLTLYNFQSQFDTQWNLLFTNILLITIPPLVMYVFFQRQIVDGMTSGAIKG